MNFGTPVAWPLIEKTWVTPLLHHAKPIISPSFEHIIQCFPRYFIFYLTSPIDKNFHKISMLGFFGHFLRFFHGFTKITRGPQRNPLPLAPRSMAKSLLILCHLGLAAALSPGDRTILGTGTSGKLGPVGFARLSARKMAVDAGDIWSLKM